MRREEEKGGERGGDGVSRWGAEGRLAGLQGLEVWAPGGEGEASRAGVWGGSNVRSWAGLGCSVQPCGGQCPVQCPRWAVVQAQGGSCPVGRPVAGARRARCGPCSLGLARQGREHSAGTPPPNPLLFGPPSHFFLSLLFRAVSSFRHSLLCPILVLGAARPPINLLNRGGLHHVPLAW